MDIKINTYLNDRGRHPWSDRKLSWLNHLCISAYWFGWSFVWMPMLVIIIPHQIQIIPGVNNAEGAKMGALLLSGSIGSLIFAPMFGHFSDCSLNKNGRRTPFIFAGITVTTIGLLLMSFSPPFPIYCTAFAIVSFGNFISLSPYAALVPDVVPYDQRGICSGWLGAMSMFGYLLGGALSYHLEKLGFFFTFIVFAIVHAFCGWISITFVPEIPLQSIINNLGIRHKKLSEKNKTFDIKMTSLKINHFLSGKQKMDDYDQYLNSIQNSCPKRKQRKLMNKKISFPTINNNRKKEIIINNDILYRRSNPNSRCIKVLNIFYIIIHYTFSFHSSLVFLMNFHSLILTSIGCSSLGFSYKWEQ